MKRIFLRTTGPISTKLSTKHPWLKGIQVCSNEGPRPSPRGDNSEIVNFYPKYLKIFFSRTTVPISTKLGTKYPWMKGIHVYSNGWPDLSSRGNNSKNVKLYWKYLKIFFFRTTGPISTKLGTILPSVKGAQIVLMKGPTLFKGGIITKWWKYIDEI